jgi:exopolysaccharide production protein ExoQ
VVMRDRFTILLALFAFASILWSAAPEASYVRAVGLIGATMFGIYLVTQYTLKEQIVVTAWAFGLIIVLSFIYAIFLPQYGIMGGVHSGDWRGIYTHKNTLGMRMVLSAATFLVLLLDSRRPSFFPALGLMASMTLIALCTSKGAMVTFTVVVGTAIACQILRWQFRYVVPLLLGSATLASVSIAWALGNLEAIADFLNKDITLTGRTDIWELVIDVIHKKPWFGYGYDAFWSQGLKGDAAYVWRAFLWEAPHAHNGFLDIWVQLGFVGIALLLMGLYFHLFHGLVQLRYTTEPEYLWPVVLLVYCIFNNLTETTFLRSNDLLWVLYVATTLQGYVTAVRPRAQTDMTMTAHDSAPAH